MIDLPAVATEESLKSDLGFAMFSLCKRVCGRGLLGRRTERRGERPIQLESAGSLAF